MNTQAYTAIIASPLPGAERLGLRISAVGLSAIDILPATTRTEPARDALSRSVVAQLQGYFEHPARGFDLPLAAQGSHYQQRVWQAMQAIAPGQTQAYGTLAGQIHSGARAVANACRANPIPIIIPCHRVVAAHGPGGYMGETQGAAMAIKHWLLEHERGRRAA